MPKNREFILDNYKMS